MEERTLGKTGLRAKRVGFGGIPIQRVTETEAINVVRGCYEIGVNYFDTARAYTTSEERIGKALKDVREEVIIATKTIKRTKFELLKDLETSLKELQTEWIDLYQLHMVSKADEWKKISSEGGALDGLYEAKDLGKINHIGITSHNPELMIDILKENIFETVMVQFNYLTPSPAEELLPWCKGNKIGTIAMKPMGGGALSDKKTALKYALNNNDIDVIIPGMMSLNEVKKNIEISSKNAGITKKDLEIIEKDKKELGNEFCRACDYCNPCPQGISISFVLRAEKQLIRLSGWNPRFEKQIPEENKKVATCLQCGECEIKCPYQLPIRELLPKKMEALMLRYKSETSL
jgi:uncharacterized protein